MITWFAQVIHAHSQYICYLTGTAYILSHLCASFDYFHLVNWIADSLQRWISSNTINQKPEHFSSAVCESPKNMLERVYAFNNVSGVLDKHVS